MCPKYPRIKFSWNQRLGDKKTKFKICCQVPTSSTQWQNRSSHVVERPRTTMKCIKMKNARAKRAKQYANFWRSYRRRRCSSSGPKVSP